MHVSCACFLFVPWVGTSDALVSYVCHLTKFFVRQLVFVGHFEGIESKGVLQVRFFR